MLTEPQPATQFSDVETDASGGGVWQRRIEMVVRSLQVRFGVGVDPALITTEVEAEFAAYAAARVREFVPILVETHVHARLRGQFRS